MLFYLLTIKLERSTIKKEAMSIKKYNDLIEENIGLNNKAANLKFINDLQLKTPNKSTLQRVVGRS